MTRVVTAVVQDQPWQPFWRPPIEHKEDPGVWMGRRAQAPRRLTSLLESKVIFPGCMSVRTGWRCDKKEINITCQIPGFLKEFYDCHIERRKAHKLQTHIDHWA